MLYYVGRKVDYDKSSNLKIPTLLSFILAKIKSSLRISFKAFIYVSLGLPTTNSSILFSFNFLAIVILLRALKSCF